MKVCGFRLKTKFYGEENLRITKNGSITSKNLGNCLSFLNQCYSDALQSPGSRVFDWMVYDFEGSNYYSGSFKVEKGKSFLELISDIDLSEFQK
jgi:hypothetical protein